MGSSIRASYLFACERQIVADLNRSGTKIAYSHDRSSIIVVDVSDAGAAKHCRVELERPLDIKSLAWIGVSDFLLVTSDHDGDEVWRVHSINIHTGAVRPIVADLGGVTIPLKVSVGTPGSLLVANNSRNARYFDAYSVTIGDNGASLVFLNDSFDSILVDDALRIRVVRKISDGCEADYLVRDGGDTVLICKVRKDDVKTTTAMGVTHDGSVAYFLDGGRGEFPALRSIDLHHRTESSIAFTSEQIDAWAFDPGDGSLAAVRSEAGKRVWTGLNAAARACLEQLGAALPDQVATSITFSRECHRMLVVTESDQIAPQLHLVGLRPEGCEPGFLSTLYRREHAPGLNVMHNGWLRSRDGLNLRVYYSLPPFEDGPPSAILLVHGGPHDRDSWGFSARHQWLTQCGYAVISVNFRGSTGFGRSFINAGDGEWGGRMQDDLEDTAQWAVEAGYACAGRIAVIGSSYGGYAALMATTRKTSPFCCAVSICGVADLTHLMEGIPPEWHARYALWKDRLADPSTPAGRAWLRERSPVYLCETIAVPILLAHGMKDRRVSVEQSRKIASRMAELGQPHRLITFENEGHEFRDAANLDALYTAIEEFLHEHFH